MATIEWKSFDVMSVGKMMAALGVLFGFIIGLLTMAFGMIIGGASGAGLGMLVIIIYPIALGIGGFIAGAVYAFIYNLLAGKVGGIKVST